TRSPLRTDSAAWLARTPKGDDLEVAGDAVAGTGARGQVDRHPEFAAGGVVAGLEGVWVVGEVAGDGDGDHGVLLGGNAGRVGRPGGGLGSAGPSRRSGGSAGQGRARNRAARAGKMFCSRPQRAANPPAPAGPTRVAGEQ